jgi:putative N-acetylmannosamine-6-phosphate epimerase
VAPSDKTALLGRLAGGLIVSVQPVTGSPLDTGDLVRAMALAVAGAGCVGLRIESVANVRAVAAATDVPVIGLVKSWPPGEPVLITGTTAEADALAAAGAAIVAFDATVRRRTVAVPAMIARIHDQGCVALADCATFEEGMAAHGAGADLVATTLAGYMGPGPLPILPDLDLIRRWAGQGLPVIAEGRIRSPEQARAAREAGALAVVVGSAITRPEHVTRWFIEALQGPAGA